MLNSYSRRPVAALAAAAVAGTTLLACLSPAHADAVITIGRADDAVADAKADRGVRAADKRAYDIDQLALRQRLTDDGRVFYDLNLSIKNGARLESTKRVKMRATLHVTGASSHKAVVTGDSTGAETFTVAGTPILCSDLSFETLAKSNAVRVTFPASCVPAGEKITAAASLNVKLETGTVSDSIGATTPATTGDDRFARASRSDASDDVTYLIDPATNRYIARSGDIENVSMATEDDRVLVKVRVLDLSTRAWDPTQQFTLSLRSSGTEVVSLSATADTSAPGKAVAASGPAGCAATALFDSDANTVTFTVPVSCARKVKTLDVVARVEVLDAEKNTAGRDTTEATRLVLVR